MGQPPDPAEIFDRAAQEGQRRIDQSTLELVSTGFIAGFTVVFGLIGLAVVEAMVEPEFGRVGKLAGALAFGVGFVFLVVGRAELFNENFFDPTAAAVDDDSWLVGPILRLWVLTFVFNLVGGVVFVAILSVEGALPTPAHDVLVAFAEETVARPPTVEFLRAITGGALVSLLSFLLAAVDGDGSRIALAVVVGAFLPLGPFDHVVVTLLHVAIGVFLGAPVGLAAVGETAVTVTAGNLVGGLGLVTLSHVGQALGARETGG